MKVTTTLTPGSISPANDSLCRFGDPVAFVSQAPTGVNGTVSYQWQVQPGCSGAWTNIPGATSLTYDPSSAGNQESCYRLELTDDSCTVYSQVVNVYPYPSQAPQLTPNGPTVGCEGDSLGFTASSGVASSFTWLFNGQVISGVTGPNYTALQPGDYAVVITNSFGCQDTSLTFALTWYPPLNPVVVSPADSTICPGDTTLLQSQVAGNVTGYQWLLDGVPIPGATNASYSATGPGNYQVQATDGNGCNYLSSGMTIVPGIAPVSLITPIFNNLICAGDSIVLIGSGGRTYQWLLNGQPIPGATDSTFAATGGGQYALVADNGCGTDTSAGIDLIFSPGPNPGFDYENYTFNQVLFFDESEGAVVWSWDLGDLISPEQNLYYSFPGPGSYEVTQTVFDSLGCSASLTQTVNVTDPEPFVPNVFTPNADGINDRAQTRFDRLNAIDFCIFDRWGNKVFLTSSPNEYWDGTIGEAAAPEGVYYYQLRALDIRGKAIVETGNITLLR